jgi:hypothetical protein
MNAELLLISEPISVSLSVALEFGQDGVAHKDVHV